MRDGSHRTVVPLAVIVTFLALLAWTPASAQSATETTAGVLVALPGAPQPWVRAEELGRVVGAEVFADASVLVLRTERAVLTLFDGSADGTLAGERAGETALSVPAERRADGWWLPLDAGAPFGLIRTGPRTLHDAQGRAWTLDVRPPVRTVGDDPRATLLQPAPGVVAVEIVSEPGADGVADRAIWLTDLALVPLLAPDLRAVVDDALADAGASRALLIVGTSRTAGATLEGIALMDGDRELLAKGARHETLAGDADAVAPDAPWIALAWLPAGTRLDLPLTIVWQGAAVEVTFRK